MAALTDKQKEFLDNAYVGSATTLRRDGSPHSTVVWIDHDGGHVLFNTARGRAKERHLRDDPRAALLVVDPANPYRWLAVSGPAELVDEGAEEHIDRLAKKYIGKDEYPWHSPEEPRVIVRIAPEHVSATGIDE